MAETTQSIARRSGRWIYLLGILGFIAYAAWIMGPYLRSVIVRDAAVTTWLNRSSSPIDGTVDRISVPVGLMVGADGVIVQIENKHLSRQPLTEAEIHVDLALVRVEELQNFLEEIKSLDRERAELKGHYADTFRAELDVQIASMRREIEVNAGRLALMRNIAARKETLASKGLVSEIVADEEAIRVSSLELDLAGLQEKLDQARVRREAADKGVFITLDGEDPEWVRGSRMELKLEKKHARLELRQAQAELRSAKATLKAAREDFERLSKGTVGAPPGSMVWSEVAVRGTTIEHGQTVVAWLDCSVLMIDVPVADAEVSLIKPGMEADVILEGETEARRAKVLFTRGSASTLGKQDLAAVAKGRRDGVAQVLLEFYDGRESFEVCPVGRAAYVDFPDIGLIDVIRARLRL
jgi:multidrug efflux pump subunit AcrA (membrane-fusion protein)